MSSLFSYIHPIFRLRQNRAVPQCFLQCSQGIQQNLLQCELSVSTVQNQDPLSYLLCGFPRNLPHRNNHTHEYTERPEIHPHK